MGTDFSSGEESGHYDKLNNELQTKLIKTRTMIKTEQQLDVYTTRMLRKKIEEIRTQITSHNTLPTIEFPPPHYLFTSATEQKTIAISCVPQDKVQRDDIFSLAMIDEYFGDLSDIHRYDRLNKHGIITPTTKPIDTNQAKEWFHDTIYQSLYALYDDKKLNPQLYNQWKHIHDSDQCVSSIAFTGYGAHRTQPLAQTNHLPTQNKPFFVNDVTFLSLYAVRSGYKTYGATAYFDANYQVTKIYVSHDGKTYTSESDKLEWQHAQWVWKVSLSVATYLVDMICHTRFRESNALIKTIQTTLDVDHPIRRLLLPFTFGTAYVNRVFNEYLKENGLYHRAFAFTYDSLCNLITDSMSKYRFRILKKKVTPMKQLPQNIYPIYNDTFDFWVHTLKFVEEYVNQYYGDDAVAEERLRSDVAIAVFYEKLLHNCGIDTGRFRLKKFNIVNVLSHFICNGSIWNHYLSSAVSFEYKINSDFTGLKILNDSLVNVANDVVGYVEYCAVVLSKGWSTSDHYRKCMILLISAYCRTNHVPSTILGIIGEYYSSYINNWCPVLLDDDKKMGNKRIFENYFEKAMLGITRRIGNRNTDDKGIVPFNAMNPQYLRYSIML
eukprot:338681_1